MTADRIRITGLQVNAHHGVFEFERTNGQLFVIDVTAHLSLAPAGASDELAQTVHYGELAEAVVRAVEADPVDLIETVAERVASVVLGFDLVDVVDVVVHKPNAPIAVPFTDVTVEITRSRR
ncbi:MAG TPA: dihydroneopterin aldolase [Pseudolysinimonas sp.]|nr:dihydroneopterin aldolase [Pseudolysinimonas sp.]